MNYFQFITTYVISKAVHYFFCNFITIKLNIYLCALIQTFVTQTLNVIKKLTTPCWLTLRWVYFFTFLSQTYSMRTKPYFVAANIHVYPFIHISITIQWSLAYISAFCIELPLLCWIIRSRSYLNMLSDLDHQRSALLHLAVPDHFTRVTTLGGQILLTNFGRLLCTCSLL